MTIGIVVVKGKGEVTPHPARPGSPSKQDCSLSGGAPRDGAGSVEPQARPEAGLQHPGLAPRKWVIKGGLSSGRVFWYPYSKGRPESIGREESISSHPPPTVPNTRPSLRSSVSGKHRPAPSPVVKESHSPALLCARGLGRLHAVRANARRTPAPRRVQTWLPVLFWQASCTLGFARKRLHAKYPLQKKKKKDPLGEVLFVFGIQGLWDFLVFIDVAHFSPSLAPSALPFCLLLVGMLHIPLPPPISR